MNNRASSVALNYVLTLGIVTILISGLLIAAGGAIQDRQEQVIRSEMSVVGQRLAANIASADRLGAAGGDVVEIDTPLPQTVAGTHYRYEVTDTATGATIELSTTDPAISLTVTVTTAADVVDGRYVAGDVTVVFTGGAVEVQQ